MLLILAIQTCSKFLANKYKLCFNTNSHMIKMTRIHNYTQYEHHLHVYIENQNTYIHIYMLLEIINIVIGNNVKYLLPYESAHCYDTP